MLRNPSADFSTNTLDAGQIVLEQLSALEREKEQWEGQCTALQNELDAVSRLYDASQEMVDSLKQTLESEVEDKNALEKSLQESQESYAVLQRQYQDLQMHQQQQIPSETTGVVENATLTPPEDLVERLADLEQALQEWQDRCSLLEALNSKEAEFQDLVGQERTQFENQMQDYEAKIQALESALQQQASSSEDAEQLRLELDSLRQQNEALSATQSLSQDSTLLKDLQERYDSSQTAIQQLEAERNSFELKIQELQDQQAQAANNINSDLDPMQQKHEYEEALRELHIVRSQLETEISMKETLQQETLQLMEEIQSQESLLQGRTAEWDVERESLRREIDDLTSRLDSDRHSWEREKAVLESQIEEVQLTAQLDASADLLDEGWGLNGTGEDPGQTGSSNSLPKKTVAQLEFDIQALQVVLDSTTQSYETQLAQTSLLLAESNSKLTSLSGLEAEYSRLRKEFDALQSQALEFQSELAKAKENAEANSSQMRSEMDALQFENEQLKVAQSSTEETSARIQELQSRLERLQLELESSRQDYANLVQEKTHQETLQRSLSQEQVEEIQSLQQKLASLSLDNLTQSQELAQEKEQVVQALQADLEKTAAEMDEMRQYILQREMELQDNGLALEECHGQIENLNGSLTELRTRLDQTDDTTRAYEDQISGLNDSIQGYLSQIAQLQDSLEQYREREETLVIEREIETQELMDLRNQSILRQTGETEELRQAMEENERLRNSVQEKESHLSQLNEEIFAIQELLQEKEALISQHEEELGAARDALLEKEEAERQRIHLTNEVADMESRLAALDEELSDYKSQIEALHIQISNKEGIIQQCDADLDEKEATIQSLERDLEAKEALIQILKRDAEALNSTLQALEADIAAKGDMEDIQHDLAQKDSIIREFEQGMAAKTAVIDRLENEVTKTAADLQGLEENLLSKDSDILTWKQEVAMKDSALLELQETVTSRDLNIQELQQQVETLSLDIERLQSSQRRLEEDYDFMRQNLEEETELFRQGLDHLNREKAELTETVARIQAELQSKTDEVESARSAVPEEFAGEFETLQYQLSAQTKELYSILDERQNMQYRIDELTLQLEELGSERSHEAQELHAQIEELASENQKYKEQITQIMSSSDELEGLKEKMAYLENVNSACQTDLEKLAEERNALELANASLVEEASILGAKLDVLTEKLRDIAGARDESDQYAAQMESENQQLKLDLDTIYAERNNLEDRLNAAQQNTESSEALALLTQELDVLRMSYAGLQSQNQELHTHIDQLSVDLQAAKVASEDASKKLMLEVSRLEEEREALTMQVSDFGSLTKDREENSALTSQVQDLLLQNEESSRVTQKLAMELDQAREDHSRAVHELQTQFDDSQTWATLVSQERDRLLEKVNEVEQNLDGVQVRIFDSVGDSLLIALQSVASQLQGLREENEKLKQHQEEIVASFKAQELELDSQIDRLMKENDEIQKRLETMAGLQVIADGVEEMKEQHLAQVGALEGQVNDLYAQVESLMSKIDQLESEKEELSMRCQQLAWEMSTISARIQTEDYAAIQSELERAQGDARTGQLRLQELEEVILSTQKELQDRHNQVESLTQLVRIRLLPSSVSNFQQVSQRDEAVADLQAQYNSASLELTEVAEKCASLEEASMLFEQQRDAIAQKLQEIAAERDAMDSARERHVEEIASLRQEMGGLQARIDGDNQAHLQAQGSNKETVEENERLWKRIETLMAEAEAMKDQTALLEGDLENSRTKLTELTDRLQLSSSEQDQVAENLRGELMAKIQEIETLEANLSHIQTEMEATDGSYKQIVAKYESAESKMHDFDDAISVLGDLSLKLGAQFTLKSAIEDILREKTSAEAKLEGLVQSFGTTTDSLVKLEEELAHKRERINDLETQLVQQRKGGEDANMLLETLRNITEDNNHLKNQLQTLYLEKEQIQMSLGDSEALQKLRKDHANLEDSYRAALEKLSSVETAASLSRQTSPVRHPLPSPQLVNQDLGADKQRLRDASFNLLMAQQESIQLNNTLSKANITIERLQHDLQLAEHNASLKLDEATGVIKVLEREVANLRALISKEPKRYPIGSPEPQVTSFRSVTPFSEFNSDSRFTRQQKIEAKLMSYVRLSENSIQSMEMYRTELLNKQEQLQDAEKEIMKLRTAIASTSVMSTA